MQVGVARPESGSWVVLTKDRDKGGFVEDVAWEPDGSAIYFDRVVGAAPRGVYRIPVLGGEPRLVVPDAMRPEPLTDGSLLVVRITEARERQLFWFRSDTGDMLALNALLTPSGDVRAFPDGREAVFHGRPADQPKARDGLYVIDVQSNRVRSLPLAVRPWWVPITTTRDGREVLIARPFGGTGGQ